MAGVPGQSARTSTLNLMLGIFLKLLGFFVVLYTYTDINPTKVQKVEESLKERFNISVSLAPVLSGMDPSVRAPLVQTKGRAYSNIENDMKTQVDFLSSQYNIDSNTLVLRVPAEMAMTIDGQEPKSGNFAKILADTLENQSSEGNVFAIEMILSGPDATAKMRDISLFVQKMIGENYPQDLMTIGYAESSQKPTLEIRIHEQPRAQQGQS